MKKMSMYARRARKQEARSSFNRAEWLNWSAHENDFGRKAMEAGPTGATRRITDFDDLIWVMGVTA